MRKEEAEDVVVLPKPTYSLNPAYSLDRAALAHPDRVSLYCGTQSWTVAQATHCTRAIAQLLRECGVGVGDRVALVARNSPYHLLIHVACARIGAVFVPISYRLAQAELTDLLEFCEPRVVVFDPETARGWTSRLAAEVFVIDDDRQASLDPGELPNVRRFAAEADMLATTAAGSPSSAAGAIAPAISVVPSGYPHPAEYPSGLAIFFTSGSTDRPKAVPLTHENLWWGSQNFRDGFEYSTQDVELVVAPLSHIGGFNGTTLDLFSHGGTIVVVREFNPGIVLRELAKHQVAIMFGVPTIYSALLAHPDFTTTDLTHFTRPLVGGASASPALLERMENAGLRPVNVWGMTEGSASGLCLAPEFGGLRRGSIGRPFTHVHIRIVDDDGAEADEGELLITGPNVVAEYWRDEGFTADLFDGPWLRTGDIVRRDDDGFVWVVGRVRYQINTGGEKVHPEEVAGVLEQMPGLREAAVVGLPDETWGQVIATLIVLDADAEAPTLREVQSFARQYIAGYKVPRVMKIVPQLPTNSNGKVDMRAVVDELMGTD